MPTELSVNLNAIAYLRNRRNLSYPSVVEAGRLALDKGAIGLTVHPRPDERHITYQDVADIAALLKEPAYQDKEFNIEGYPDERFMEILDRFRPNQATFVPDDPAQVTSDHGWDIAKNEILLKAVTAKAKESGMRVALFIDADATIPALAKAVGADRVELYTGPYGAAIDAGLSANALLSALGKTAKAALEVGLEVNAGHDLTVENLPALIKIAPNIVEVSIGHGITSDALFYGLEKTIERFMAACHP